MVPGEFSTVIPFFKASPLRGRICASNPCGIAMNSPVGTRHRCMGAKEIGSEILARISIPAESSVAYAGSGCFDLLITCMFIFSLFTI